MKYIIKTDKGYICVENAKGVYELKNSSFYAIETGKWFTSRLAGTSEVDKLGFTNNKKEATRYFGCVGNRVQEILDRVKFGFEKFRKIEIEILYNE